MRMRNPTACIDAQQATRRRPGARGREFLVSALGLFAERGFQFIGAFAGRAGPTEHDALMAAQVDLLMGGLAPVASALIRCRMRSNRHPLCRRPSAPWMRVRGQRIYAAQAVQQIRFYR
jgi:hypothetical protein